MKLARATAAEHSGDSTDMHVRASRAERSWGGGDREQRKASSEYVESGRQDSSVPHRNIQPHENACGRVHAEGLCFLWFFFFFLHKCVWILKLKWRLYLNAPMKYGLCTSLIKKKINTWTPSVCLPNKCHACVLLIACLRVPLCYCFHDMFLYTKVWYLESPQCHIQGRIVYT